MDERLTVDGFLERGGPVRVIAHRGFSARAPENTLAAFRKAIETGADMIELDVLSSRDGEVVVIHDDTLERTTDGTGRVEDRDLEELKELDAGSWFGAEFASERVPTLEEALGLACPRTLVNVEVKSAARGLVGRTIDLLSRLGRRHDVLLSSFDPMALFRAREIDPGIRTATLWNEELHAGRPPLAVMEEVGAVALHVALREVTSELVETCHRAGRPVCVYTVNEESEMRRCMDMGVHALFTDRPDRLLRLRRR